MWPTSKPRDHYPAQRYMMRLHTQLNRSWAHNRHGGTAQTSITRPQMLCGTVGHHLMAIPGPAQPGSVFSDSSRNTTIQTASCSVPPSTPSHRRLYKVFAIEESEFVF
jgi:hypothetical protein